MAKQPKKPEPAPEYATWTVDELHQEATARGLEGRAGLGKADLVKLLEKADKDAETVNENHDGDPATPRPGTAPASAPVPVTIVPAPPAPPVLGRDGLPVHDWTPTDGARVKGAKPRAAKDAPEPEEGVAKAYPEVAPVTPLPAIRTTLPEEDETPEFRKARLQNQANHDFPHEKHRYVCWADGQPEIVIGANGRDQAAARYGKLCDYEGPVTVTP